MVSTLIQNEYEIVKITSSYFIITNFTIFFRMNFPFMLFQFGKGEKFSTFPTLKLHIANDDEILLAKIDMNHPNTTYLYTTKFQI